MTPASSSSALRRGCAALAAGVAALALTAAPASAQIKSFTDPKGDVHASDTNLDVGRVVVQHAPDFVRVRLFVPPHDRRANPSTFSDGLTYEWFDTDASRPGPEYGAVVSYGEGPASASVYPAFQDRSGFHVRMHHTLCDGTASANRRDKSSQVIVPRSCLGDPTKLRVNVAISDESHLYPVEYAPGQRQFGPWTKVG